MHRACKSTCPALIAAIKKYGKDNFSYQTIYRSFERDHTLKVIEPFFIRLFRSFGPDGYNLTSGGQGTFGRVISTEQREAMRARRLGRKASPETRAKLSAAQRMRPTGPPSSKLWKKHTAEHIAKIIASRSGYRPSAETRHKCQSR